VSEARAGGRAIGVLDRAPDFLAHDGDRLRRDDAEAHFAAGELGDDDLDVVADADALAFAASDDEHVSSERRESRFLDCFGLGVLDCLETVLVGVCPLAAGARCWIITHMRQLVYSSAAVVPFSEAELTTLLARARANNARLGLSGMLLYDEGSFLQVLEGETGVLSALFDVIGRDKRHHRVTTLLEREVDGRHFGEWHMGFASAKNLPEHLPGYSEYLRLRGVPAEAPNAAVRLLAAFRDGRFRSYVAG
jgi:hypothetical protein